MFERTPVGQRRPSPSRRKRAGARISAAAKRLRGRNGAVAALAALGFLLLGWAAFYGMYIMGLPDIRTIEDDRLAESTVFLDRNGQELYRASAGERRQYVPYAQFSENMVHAIVSAEDKTFFTNPGIDFMGLVRAVGKFVLGQDSQVRGTSTISQQLMKQWYLSNDRSLDRKIKEAYLSWRLNQTYTKEKILELYLNKISFGSNAFGVEQASRTFFGKGIKDVGVLGASILASLPKGPTYYSPYSHRDRLMGYLYATDRTGDPAAPQAAVTGDPLKSEWAPFYQVFRSFADGLTFDRVGASKVRACGVKPELFKKSLSVGSDGCRVMAFEDLLGFWNSVSVRFESLPEAVRKEAEKDPKKLAAWKAASFEYQTGRKDFVLGRMYEDDAIDGKQYLKAVIDGLLFTFKPYREDIRAPHFVFMVRDLLAKKYGEDVFAQGGMKVTTTIDLNLQKKAEAIVAAKAKDNAVRANASSAAVVTLDNATGEILAMVGSADYFDVEKAGQVNVATSRRQPGSSFKPLVYALAMSKAPVGPSTPMYDLPTKFGDWEPKNFDGEFLGKMTVKTALGNSRNIPAAKMFYLAGGQGAVVDFARSAGIESLDPNADYGAPLAIGVGEVKPLEMAEAYATLANLGVHRDAVAILKVEDVEGNVIEQAGKPVETRVLPEGAAWLVWNILSDTSSRPDMWNQFLLPYGGRPVAVKTGTSNKEVAADDPAAKGAAKDGDKRILPRDLWTVGYTPQVTTVVWVGNADGSPTNTRGDGLQSAGPIFRDVMAAALEGKPVVSEPQPASVAAAVISSANGKLASSGTPGDLRVTGLFFVPPTDVDATGEASRTIDALCNGPVTPETPASAVRAGRVLDLDTVVDHGQPDWLESVQGWASQPDNQAKLGGGQGGVVFGLSPEPCVRPEGRKSPTISVDLADKSVFALEGNHLEAEWSAPSSADGNALEVLLDGAVSARFPLTGSSGRFATDELSFPRSALGRHAMTVRVMDRWLDSASASADVAVAEKPVLPPQITMLRPQEGGDMNVNIYPDQSTNVRATVSTTSSLRAVNLYVDGKLAKVLGGVREVVEEINANHDFPVGVHALRIEALDAAFNRATADFTVTVLPR